MNGEAPDLSNPPEDANINHEEEQPVSHGVHVTSTGELHQGDITVTFTNRDEHNTDGFTSYTV